MLERALQKLIGYRVKAAREMKGWTQDQLTDALSFNDRQTVSDIENGKRALKPDELVQLSESLDRELDFFLDPFAVAGEAQFSWRAASEIPEESLDRFELKAGQWIGLLRWLREREPGRKSPLKYSLRLTAQSSFEDAQERAERLVELLELGVLPAERLIEQIERDLDIPVLFVDTVETNEGQSISGATCHLQDLGVILVNRNESEARRFYDLAHELFHALTWDAMKPDHRESNSFEERARGKRIEQLANNFAAALLMPRASLEHLFMDKASLTDVPRLAELAALLRVAPVALAWRLYNLKWIEEGTRRALSQERLRPSLSGQPKRFSESFAGMLHRSIDRGLLSARKAAKAMGMTLSDLVDVFAEHKLTAPFEL
jgi:Zn-dependent peptidase ImmA (M78 family)/transcriptional regulator with XRE-family HTH domain